MSLSIDQQLDNLVAAHETTMRTTEFRAICAKHQLDVRVSEDVTMEQLQRLKKIVAAMQKGAKLHDAPRDGAAKPQKTIRKRSTKAATAKKTETSEGGQQAAAHAGGAAPRYLDASKSVLHEVCDALGIGFKSGNRPVLARRIHAVVGNDSDVLVKRVAKKLLRQLCDAAKVDVHGMCKEDAATAFLRSTVHTPPPPRAAAEQPADDADARSEDAATTDYVHEMDDDAAADTEEEEDDEEDENGEDDEEDDEEDDDEDDDE